METAFGLERDLPFTPAIAAGLVDKFLEWVTFPGELMLVEGRIRPKARIFAIWARQSLWQVMLVLVLAL